VRTAPAALCETDWKRARRAPGDDEWLGRLGSPPDHTSDCFSDDFGYSASGAVTVAYDHAYSEGIGGNIDNGRDRPQASFVIEREETIV
jgi:hypothetical protein